MFGKKKSMLAISEINKIVEEKAQVDEMLAQVQREKDLELKKIEKKYELKIDSIMRRVDDKELLSAPFICKRSVKKTESLEGYNKNRKNIKQTNRAFTEL